ncbi:hypothetical protein GOP47_0004184 [Adiantum capillus-veneris]|uniref:30S ribosomal protein S8 n=1 Tax=Adiantum capillus-veneris TaxID=13818 RepID=A0A9D4V720_ADICA|nr:hypothetical protein GOP47_0004184 [Adiantum capillus-veneris]
MVQISVLNDALKNMYNAEKRSKRQALLKPSAEKIVVELNGRLNKRGVISPHYDVAIGELEAWTTRLPPSRQFGHILLTTSARIMDRDEARRKNVGGKVLRFFY